MDLLNQKLNHISLGTGEVISQEREYITVKFNEKTCKFCYPSAFVKFLKAEDATKQKAINEDIAIAKAADEKAMQAAEEIRIAEEEKLKASIIPPKTKSKSKTAKKANRIPGKPMVYIVFQGESFETELSGGYIWAPIHNSSGRTCHHWERLLDVRRGDIILHCVDGAMKAISTADAACYDAIKPYDFKKEESWAKEGRRVDCEYIKIHNPIRTSNYKDKIQEYSDMKYAPFNKKGNPNTGYLYEINRDLARIFIRDLMKENSYLVEQKYLKEIVDE